MSDPTPYGDPDRFDLALRAAAPKFGWTRQFNHHSKGPIVATTNDNLHRAMYYDASGRMIACEDEIPAALKRELARIAGLLPEDT